MTQNQWKIFCDFKAKFKIQVELWSKEFPELTSLQKKAANDAGTPPYPFETGIVYNRALDDLNESDDIKLIVIGDNPGKNEQLLKNNRYLVGQAGKIAEGYFKRNPELGVDFRKNVIILNKTPVHSAKTNQLKTIVKYGGSKIANLLVNSQIWMAEETAKLHIALNRASSVNENCELWMVGYSELTSKGIFESYRDTLKSYYMQNALGEWEKVFVFQHFSMNRFSIDLKNNFDEKESLQENIHRLGLIHKNQIF